jgi:hypothetical protein
MLSDMDMIPLQRDFFVKGFEQFSPMQFVSLRGIDENEKQIYMCYVGARPTVWSEMFGIKTVDDVRARLIEYSEQYQSNGKHGSVGWCSDQILLYNVVKETTPDKIGLVSWTPEIPRLDRIGQNHYIQHKAEIDGALQNGIVVDYHMPPYTQNKDTIHKILDITCSNPTPL